MTNLHEVLHAASPGSAQPAPLHCTQLVQVLQQNPGLLDGPPQPLPPLVHLHPQSRPTTVTQDSDDTVTTQL